MEEKEFIVENAFKRLEEITRQLESQGTSLKDSMKLYAEGVELSKKCKENLEGVEKEIKILAVKDDDK